MTTCTESKRVRIVSLKGTEQILCAMLCPPKVQACAPLTSPSDNAEPISWNWLYSWIFEPPGGGKLPSKQEYTYCIGI